LGYGGGRARGFKIHSEAPFTTEKISRFCYPDEPSLPTPAISGMYYYYNALAKLFRQNLVSKAGDDASIRDTTMRYPILQWIANNGANMRCRPCTTTAHVLIQTTPTSFFLIITPLKYNLPFFLRKRSASRGGGHGSASSPSDLLPAGGLWHL
jgi:hypothetical protein